MAYELKEGEGSLFENDKRDRETSPHKKGKCKIDGKEYYISCWHNTTKNGAEYLSLKFKPVAVQAEQEEMPF